MANRTTNIIGRVLRNLKRAGILSSDITDDEIVDEMNQCTIQINSESNPDKIISITLQTGIDSYILTASTSNKNNIASVRAVKLPTDWTYKFSIISNKEFVDKVNLYRNNSLTQPVIGTVIDAQLKIYPTPILTDNNKVLELYTYLSSSVSKIDINTEPELPDIWDKCYELFCSAQFLSGNDRAEYLTEFVSEVKRLRVIPHRKSHTMQSPSVW